VASEYLGLLCIGDPHLASHVPGFRKDDYPRAILDKLSWALEYASKEHLLPAILGDLFHVPRNNANRLVVELLEMFDKPVLGIAGNHDCQANDLESDDTLSVLWAAGRLQLLERSGPWRGTIGGRTVVIGGTGWGQRLPQSFDRTRLFEGDHEPLIIWLTHHDVRFCGYEESGRFDPREIPGVDVCINGHIHRPLADAVAGMTTWLNPGNIARIKRSDGDRNRKPSVLRIDVKPDAWYKQAVEVPFRPFEEVFHENVVSEESPLGDSLFVRGLAALESLKTQGGAGLKAFLEQNLDQFDPRVATEIRVLASEVIPDEPIERIPSGNERA
jgi:DNA repair exonuclease SbcCD nuclease subunit